MTAMKVLSDSDLFVLTQQVAQCLRDIRYRLSTAESCTGGWVAKCCTDLSGSSAWFDRGFVTYSNNAKQELLGVPQSVIAKHGAVSQAVVEAMALGALTHSQADISVSISGIAGPDGGSPEKPVGTVWIAWATQSGRMTSQHFHFQGDRDAIRRQAVSEALKGIIKNASGERLSMG
jgi:nicotinamide-nucleotide amidase